jgi:hypothetical protein
MSVRFLQAASVAGWLMASGLAVQAEPPAPPAEAQVPSPRSQEPPSSRGVAAPGGAKSPATCPGLHGHVDKLVAPIALIIDGPLPEPKPERAPTESEIKCMESLKAAGKKDIEEGRLVQGTSQFMAAVHVALPLASTTYRGLAAALDKMSHPDPAVAAYRKAWAALEIEHERSGTKVVEGVIVLAMADIRDAIIRLGGQAPVPTSELGRIVIANTTRILLEQYFERAIPVPPAK